MANFKERLEEFFMFRIAEDGDVNMMYNHPRYAESRKK